MGVSEALFGISVRSTQSRGARPLPLGGNRSRGVVVMVNFWFLVQEGAGILLHAPQDEEQALGAAAASGHALPS